MWPLIIVLLSLITLRIGAIALVVHDAADRIISLSRLTISWFTPYTIFVFQHLEQ